MKKKIVVLHVIKSLGRGGAEMLLPETLALHDQDRFEFHYVYFLPWKDQMVDAIRQAGGRVTCFSASNNIRLMLKVRTLRQYVKQHHIDIIHAHLPWAGFVSRLVFRVAGVPVIYTEHNKQERYHKITYYLNKITFGWQSRVVAVSQDVADSIRKNIGLKTRVDTILNGVNTSKFRRSVEAGVQIRRDHNIPEEALVVGTVAVFRFQKRLQEWLRVFAQALDQNPDLYGIIVGDGPLKDEIVELREELGLTERVILPGLQTNTISWYSAMDIFMMTSVFEGLPVALLEAMSTGCTIVSTNAGGISEVVKNDKSGLLVDVEAVAELCQRLLILKSEQLRHRLAYGARVRVVEYFSLDRMVRNLENIYDSECINR